MRFQHPGNSRKNMCTIPRKMISWPCLLLFSFLAVTFFSFTAAAQSHGSDTALDMAGDQLIQSDTHLLGPSDKPVPEIDGSAFVLYAPQSKTFLLGENQDEPLPPASITKVMTALLALENMALSDTITVTGEMFETIPNDYARLGLVEGEIITVSEALHASLLISANDAAMALAIAMGGTVEHFADLMNDRARELGCRNTHFTNPYGYADPNHMTSASDMALITAEALQHAAFREITTKKHALIEPTNLCPESRGLPNGNRFVTSDQYIYEHYTGGKTGYTRLSRYTIVAGAKLADQELVGVILGASNAPVRYENLINLFAYGFSYYATESVDLSSGDPLVRQVVSQIETKAALAEPIFTVVRTDLQLVDFVTNHRAAGSFSLNMDTNDCNPQTGLDEQKLLCPVFCQYEDGSRIQAGYLNLYIEVKKKLETMTHVTETSGIEAGTETAAQENKQLFSLGRLLLIGLLLLIFVFSMLLLLAMIRRDLHRKRRGRRSSRL